MRFRFTLRSLMAAVLLWGVALTLLLRWWTQPYAITGSYASGARTWEQGERRTATGKVIHLKTIGWRRNGQKAFEHDFVNQRPSFWSPNGQPLSDVREFWSYYREDSMQAKDDPESRRPMETLLRWWNEW